MRMRHNFMWPAPFYNIFPHYFINGMIFENLLNIKCVFWFSLQIYLKYFSFYEEMSMMWSYVYRYSRNVPVIFVMF
jgi:hypothetical protein